MMPVSGSASLKALAVLTASWPCMASTTNRVSTGFSAACRFLISSHQRFVNCQTAGGIDQQHVKEMLFGVVQRGAANVHGILVRRGGEPLGARLGRHGFQLLDSGRAVHVA